MPAAGVLAVAVAAVGMLLPMWPGEDATDTAVRHATGLVGLLTAVCLALA